MFFIFLYFNSLSYVIIYVHCDVLITRLHRIWLRRCFKRHCCHFLYLECHDAYCKQCFLYACYLFSYKTRTIRGGIGVFCYHVVLVLLSRLWSEWRTILHHKVRSTKLTRCIWHTSVGIYFNLFCLEKHMVSLKFNCPIISRRCNIATFSPVYFRFG